MENIITGISLGLRQLIKVLGIDKKDILGHLKVKEIDLSLNQNISAQSWYNLIELFFTLYGKLEILNLEQSNLDDLKLASILKGIEEG